MRLLERDSTAADCSGKVVCQSLRNVAVRQIEVIDHHVFESCFTRDESRLVPVGYEPSLYILRGTCAEWFSVSVRTVLYLGNGHSTRKPR